MTRTGKAVRGVTVKALAALVAAPWPGNVRQLEHAVHQLVALCPECQPIDSELLPQVLGRDLPTAGAEKPSDDWLPLERRVEALEREAIADALGRSGGNRSGAARLLGLSRNGLAKKLHRYGIGRG